MVKEILENKPKYPTTLSDTARDFLEKCLAYNAEERPTAAELYEHPFVCKSMQKSRWMALHPNNFITIELARSSISEVGGLPAGQVVDAASWLRPGCVRDWLLHLFDRRKSSFRSQRRGRGPQKWRGPKRGTRLGLGRRRRVARKSPPHDPSGNGVEQCIHRAAFPTRLSRRAAGERSRSAQISCCPLPHVWAVHRPCHHMRHENRGRDDDKDADFDLVENAHISPPWLRRSGSASCPSPSRRSTFWCAMQSKGHQFARHGVSMRFARPPAKNHPHHVTALHRHGGC